MPSFLAQKKNNKLLD